MADSCATCKAYLPIAEPTGEPRGWCRLDPPVVDRASELGVVSRYPTCLATYWCTKFIA